jgi:endonuclease VIII
VPEGDSVWRTARRLDRGLAERVLVCSDFRVPQHATADLSGRRVLGTETHGKHLLTRFEGDRTLHTHLRMDGEWRVLAPGRRIPRQSEPEVRVVLLTDAGPTALALRMPIVQLLRTDDEHRVVGHLGPDPLRADFDSDEAVRRLGKDPERPLVSALLDQRLLAGLGNLWVNELAFVRGHSPWIPVGAVDLDKVVALAARMLRQSITVSISGRGNGQVTTGDSRRGHEHWVYGRTGLPCRRCGTLVRHAKQPEPSSRDTWWCPRCQPGPTATGPA